MSISIIMGTSICLLLWNFDYHPDAWGRVFATMNIGQNMRRLYTPLQIVW